jgi:transcriptional antiterminator
MSEVIDKRSQLVLKKLFSADRPMTSEELATIANVSSRTIKADMKKIGRLLSENGVFLSAKTGCGYQIEIVDNDLFEQFRYQLKFESNEVKRIPQTKYERINYVIMKLLIVDYYMPISEICDEIFIEDATLVSYFKEINSILKSFQLKLVENNKQEIFIEGAEFHKRICISEFFFHNDINEDYSAEDNIMFSSTLSKNEIRKIREVLLKVIKNHDIQLSPFSVENLSIHILVALRRWFLYDYVKIDDSIASKVMDTIELEAGRELVGELEKEFGIVLPDNEAIYFALHLKSKRINVKADPFKDANEEIKLQKTLKEIFDVIEDRFGIDFHNDSVIENYLKLHLRAMIERLEIGFTVRNPQSYEQRREFLLATRMSKIAVKIIEANYNISILENEEGFIVLYFNFALYRIDEKKGLNIGIVNGDGRPEGIIILNKIYQARAGIPDNISLIDVAKLEEDNGLDFDVIISTTKLFHVEKVPVIVFENSRAFSTERLTRALESLSFNIQKNREILMPENFFWNVKGSDIKEVNYNIVKLLINNGERELADNIDFDSPIDLGEGFALLFCNKEPDNLTIRLFSLKKAVILDHMPVQFVIVFDSPKKDFADFSKICNILSKLLVDGRTINAFKQDPSYQTFLDCVKSTAIYSD